MDIKSLRGKPRFEISIIPITSGFQNFIFHFPHENGLYTWVFKLFLISAISRLHFDKKKKEKRLAIVKLNRLNKYRSEPSPIQWPRLNGVKYGGFFFFHVN